MTKSEFFNMMYRNAPANMGGLYMSVMLAQAALESSYGQNWFAKKYNNYFGIKAGSGWTGKRASAYTHEYVNGEKVVQTSDFRVYDTIKDGIRGYITFLKNNQRYEKNGVFSAKTPKEECEALQRAGYATSPNYAKTLISIINTYELKKYDKKKRLKKVLIISILAGFIIFKLVRSKN